MRKDVLEVVALALEEVDFRLEFEDAEIPAGVGHTHLFLLDL
jgi:hypothetical protein